MFIRCCLFKLWLQQQGSFVHEHKQDFGNSEVTTNVMVLSKTILSRWTNSMVFFFFYHKLKIAFSKIWVRLDVVAFCCTTWIYRNEIVLLLLVIKTDWKGKLDTGEYKPDSEKRGWGNLQKWIFRLFPSSSYLTDCIWTSDLKINNNYNEQSRRIKVSWF